MTRDTCWTLIRAVRDGDALARSSFADRYLPAVRAYLSARWKSGPLAAEAEDACQEVFVRCFAESGPLERLGSNGTPLAEGGFSGFLYGVCRNVAREMEAERGRHAHGGGTTAARQPADDERLSAVFDKAFARQVMKEAREVFRVRAESGGAEGLRRYELLALRFEEGLPVREIAKRWNEDAARVHKEYARARREYREALLDVVSDQNPGRSAAELEEAAHHLLEILR